jgi:hypothetical protein
MLALRSGRFPPVPLRDEAEWAPEPVWALSRKVSCLAGNRTPIPLLSSSWTSLYRLSWKSNTSIEFSRHLRSNSERHGIIVTPRSYAISTKPSKPLEAPRVLSSEI